MHISKYISSTTFACSSKLMVDIDSMGPDLQLVGDQFSNFLLGKVSLEFKLHGTSILHDIQIATYFGTGWRYSHMVGYAGSPTYTVYVDVTLTRSKSRSRSRGLLNFRQLAKPCMLATMTAAHLRGFLVAKLTAVSSVMPGRVPSAKNCSFTWADLHPHLVHGSFSPPEPTALWYNCADTAYHYIICHVYTTTTTTTVILWPFVRD